MVTQQENKERIKQLNLDYNCYQPDKEPLCAVVKRDPQSGGLIQRSGYLNARGLNDWLDGYSERAKYYPIDLETHDLKKILADNGVRDYKIYAFVDFLNRDSGIWASKEVESFKEDDL